MASRKIATLIGASVAVICGVALVANRYVHDEDEDSMFEPADLFEARLHQHIPWTPETIRQREMEAISVANAGQHIAATHQNEATNSQDSSDSPIEVSTTVDVPASSHTPTADTETQKPVPVARILAAWNKIPDTWFFMVIALLTWISFIFLNSNLAINSKAYLSAAYSTLASFLRILLCFPLRVFTSLWSPRGSPSPTPLTISHAKMTHEVIPRQGHRDRLSIECERLTADNTRILKTVHSLRQEVGAQTTLQESYRARMNRERDLADAESRRLLNGAMDEVARLREIQDTFAHERETAVQGQKSLKQIHMKDQNSIRALQHELQVIRDSSQTEADSVKGQLKTSTNRVQDLETQNGRLQEENQELQRVSSQRDQRHEQTKAEIGSLQARLKESNDQLRGVRNSLKAKFDELDKEREALRRDFNDLNLQMSTASTQAQELEEELSKMRTSEEKAWSQVEHYRTQGLSYRRRRDEALRQAGSSKKQADSLNAELGRVKKEHEELKKAHSALLTEHETCHTAQQAQRATQSPTDDEGQSEVPSESDSDHSEDWEDYTDSDDEGKDDDGKGGGKLAAGEASSAPDDLEARRTAAQAYLQMTFGSRTQGQPTEDEPEASDHDVSQTDVGAVQSTVVPNVAQEQDQDEEAETPTEQKPQDDDRLDPPTTSDAMEDAPVHQPSAQESSNVDDTQTADQTPPATASRVENEPSGSELPSSRPTRPQIVNSGPATPAAKLAAISQCARDLLDDETNAIYDKMEKLGGMGASQHAMTPDEVQAALNAPKEPVCSICKQPGHLKVACPNGSKKDKKGKKGKKNAQQPAATGSNVSGAPSAAHSTPVRSPDNVGQGNNSAGGPSDAPARHSSAGASNATQQRGRGGGRGNQNGRGGQGRGRGGGGDGNGARGGHGARGGNRGGARGGQGQGRGNAPPPAPPANQNGGPQAGHGGDASRGGNGGGRGGGGRGGGGHGSNGSANAGRRDLPADPNRLRGSKWGA